MTYRILYVNINPIRLHRDSDPVIMKTKPGMQLPAYSMICLYRTTSLSILI